MTIIYIYWSIFAACLLAWFINDIKRNAAIKKAFDHFEFLAHQAFEIEELHGIHTQMCIYYRDHCRHFPHRQRLVQLSHFIAGKLETVWHFKK